MCNTNGVTLDSPMQQSMSGTYMCAFRPRAGLIENTIIPINVLVVFICVVQ